ncbi:MAG TPA: hypothetical protein V6C99_01890 [Oculatellaceae cyanobacterium]
MAITYETLNTQFEVESMPNYAEIRDRFEQGFEEFVSAKKLAAVKAILPEEIPSETLVCNEDFIQAIAKRVDDEAILEKRYIFISVNPKALI